MKNETRFNKIPYAENELVACYGTLETFQARGQNIDFKSFQQKLLP